MDRSCRLEDPHDTWCLLSPKRRTPQVPHDVIVATMIHEACERLGKVPDDALERLVTGHRRPSRMAGSGARVPPRIARSCAMLFDISTRRGSSRIAKDPVRQTRPRDTSFVTRPGCLVLVHLGNKEHHRQTCQDHARTEHVERVSSAIRKFQTDPCNRHDIQQVNQLPSEHRVSPVPSSSRRTLGQRCRRPIGTSDPTARDYSTRQFVIQAAGVGGLHEAVRPGIMSLTVLA